MLQFSDARETHLSSGRAVRLRLPGDISDKVYLLLNLLYGQYYRGLIYYHVAVNMLLRCTVSA